MAQKFDSRQTVSRDTLPEVVNAAGTELDDILRQIDGELTVPFVMRPTSTASRQMNIGSISLTNSATGKNRSAGPIVGEIPTFLSGFVIISNVGAGSATPSVGSAITLNMVANEVMKIAVFIDKDGNIALSKGTTGASEALAGVPQTIASTHAVGYFVVTTDGANATSLITSDTIYQFVGGGGAGGSSFLTVSKDNTNNNDIIDVDSQVLLDASTANFGLTLAPITQDGQRVRFIDTTADLGTNNVIITPDGANTIYGAANLSLNINNGHIELVANGTDWEVLGLYAGANGAGGGGSSGDVGTGEINYVTNSDAEVDTTNWTATGSAAITRTVAAGEVLRGLGSFKLASSGAGTVYTDFILEEADEQKLLKIAFDLKEITGYTAGDWTIKITKDPLGTPVDITPSTTDVPGGQGQFTSSFSSAEVATYRLTFTCAAATNGISIDNVIVGPGSIVTGAIVGPITTFSASMSTGTKGSTIVEDTAFWKRTGESMYLKWNYKHTAAGTAGSGNYILTIPDGKTANLLSANSSLSSENQAVVGKGYISDGTTRHNIDVLLRTDKTLFFRSRAGSFSFIASSGVNFGDATLIVNIEASIPIAEWAGSGTTNLGANDVEYAYNSSTATTGDNATEFAYGPGGTRFYSVTAGGKRTVRFQTPIQATDRVVLEIYVNGAWLPMEGNTYNASLVSNLILQNTTYYGAGIIKAETNGTDVVVQLGTYSAASGSTYGAAGTNWSSVASTVKWRVVKHRSGIPVGFGLATADNAGLVLPKNMPGTDTNDNADAGSIGEYVEDVGSNTATLTSNVSINAHSISLTAGDWEVGGHLNWNVSGAAATTVQIASIGFNTVSNTFPTIYDINTMQGVNITGFRSLTPSIRISLSSTTTVYMVIKYVHVTGTTGTVNGAAPTIIARRVR